MAAARWTCVGAAVSVCTAAALFAQGTPDSSELRVVVRNALSRPRAGETVEVPASALRPLAGGAPAEITEGLLRAAENHRRGGEAQDDVTLLVARFRGV